MAYVDNAVANCGTAGRIAELENRLAPGTESELIGTREKPGPLRVLVAQYPNIRASGEDDARMRGYLIVAQRYGLSTVKAAVIAAIDGQISKPGYMPLAPELAAWCRAHERLDRETLARLRSQNVSRETLPDYAARERIGKGFELLSKSLDRTIAESKLDAERGSRSLTARNLSDGSRDGD